MASVEEFESLLKDVVSAKRLSASKMTKLTEIAMKTMEHDTELVSILYRTHKSLPAANKISSLYVFDALSRAARHHANKHGIAGDLNSSTGNSASFLLKEEAILEGLFEDMMAANETKYDRDSPDMLRLLQEKTKKILDIWVKGNTFPSSILTRLTDIVEGKGKESEMKPKPLITTDPRVAAAPHPAPLVPSASPLTPATDPQATLLALLTQAANSAVTTDQTAVNTTPGLETTQLALLQQLALAQANNPQSPVSPKTELRPGPQQPRSEDFGASYGNLTNGGSDGSQPVHHQEGSCDDRYMGMTGGRGRGRGHLRDHDGRGRWDGRGKDGDKDNVDWSPTQRRSSRSRSPVRPGNRRDPRQHSPPRRDSWGNRSPNGRDTGGTKDEFGRDVRPQSPVRNTPPPTVDPRRPPMQGSRDGTAQKTIPGSTSDHNRMSLTNSVAANTSSNAPSGASVVSGTTGSTSAGLENFDPTTFDFTSPASWEVLGKMWQATHGYTPATEELAQFVFTAQAAFVDPTIQQQQNSQSQQGWSNNQSSRGWRGSGRGRGTFARGRGGSYMNGAGRGGVTEWGSEGGNYDTDAVVLGSNYTNGVSNHMEVSPIDQSQNSGGGGGRMQKVGDKWVFVRD